jgi:galactitol-specific phosphotransferase system IIC component
VTLRYHGRRISEIGWVRFGIGGGVFAGLFVPAFIVVARLLSGEGFLPPQNLLANGLVAAVLGAVAAGGSLKLTQLAGALFPGRSQD